MSPMMMTMTMTMMMLMMLLMLMMMMMVTSPFGQLRLWEPSSGVLS
jgi:hypothetical protein